MSQTITEKIFSEHVGKKVYAGEIIRSNIDMVIGNDITTPISIRAFEESGKETLANPEGFAIVLIILFQQKISHLQIKQKYHEILHINTI